MRGRCARVALGAAAALLLFAPLPAAHAVGPVPSSFVKGVSTNIAGWGSQGPQVAREITAIGAGWAREDLAWSGVMPNASTHDWSSFDNTLATAKGQGLTVLPILGYAPSWTTPNDTAGYADFVKQAVARYGPGTSANLTYFELWNEPYFGYAWQGRTPDPGQYARLYAAAVRAARTVNPNARFLIAAENADNPTTTGWATTWIDDLFAAVPDLGPLIDGISFHPYGGDPLMPSGQSGYRDLTGKWAFARIDSAHSRFQAHGVDKPFWLTEIGWSTAEVSELEQADNYSHLFPEIHVRSWVQALFPYSLRECCGNPTDPQQHYGLERWPDFSHKPAYDQVKLGFAGL